MDPLKFAVAIQDEATKQLENIQKEFDKLKDQTINVKVSGLDELRQLLSALQHQQVNNLGNEVSMGLKAAAEGLQKEAQEAVRSSLGKLAEELALVKTAIQHDNFTAFSGRIQKCAEAVDALDAAFKKFHVTIGQDEGMRNFMVGLGEVIRNVRSTMGTLEVGKNGGISAIANNYERNVQRIEDAMRRIRETHLILGDKLGKAGSAGIGVDNRYIYMLDAYQRKLEQIRRDEEVMHGKGWNADNAYKDLLRNAGNYIKYLDSQIQKQKTIETNQRRYNTALEEMQKLLARLDAASTRGFGLGVDTTRTNAALQDVQRFIEKLLLVNNKNLGDSHFINELIAEYTRLKSTLSSVAREQENLNKTTEKTNKKDADKKTRDARKENDAWAESMRRAGVEATKLEIQIRKLHEAEARGKLAKIDVTNLSARIAELQNFANILRSIESGSRSYGHASEVVNSVPYQNAIRLAQEESAAVRKAASEKERAAHSAQQLTAEEQRLAQAMHQSTQSARNQSQVLGDLKGMMMQYLSVYGAQQFLTEMANITGELELQKKSLEVIIGSAQTAGTLFGDIRDLSQMSPYTFQDLLKSTRQLAAFGIETKDLYGTMRALSDIGAGLSVDVQRLILAYGHVRSYGYLSGIQNRQFETAGVDMVGALADRYNRLADAEERAGRAAEHVTRKDIFNKMRKREISFEDVNAVIMDLDKPGGRFYNMQERQFDTLGGKLRNLRNNYNIMMAEMGESNKGLLMGSVNMLNELTAHWDKYAHLITSILVPIGAYKLATLALNGALGMQANVMARNVVAMGQSAKAMEAMNAVQLRGGAKGMLGAFMGGWKSQSGAVSRADALRFRNVLSKGLEDGSLTNAQVRMMALSNELPTRLRSVAGAMSGLTGAELKAAAGATGMNRQFMLMKLRLATAGASLRAFGASMVSMLFGPQAAVMAVIAGITALWSHFSGMAEEVERVLGNLSESAKRDAKSISDVIAQYKERGVTQSGETSYINGERIVSVGLAFDMEKVSQMTKADVEALKLELQKYSPFYEGDLVDIGKFESQAEQVIAIMKKLDSYRHAEEILSATANSHKAASDGRSNWYFLGIGARESFVTNLQDMSKAFGIAKEQVDKFSEEQIDEFDKAMSDALSRAVKSGAAVSKAEALKQKLIGSLELTGSEKNRMVSSWNNTELSDLFKRYQVFAGNIHTPAGLARAYRGDFKKNAELLGESIRKETDKFSVNDIDGALKYAIEVYQNFAAEAKNVSEDVKQYGLEMVLQSVFGGGSKFAEGFKQYQNKQFAADVYSEISRMGNISIFSTGQEIETAVQSSIESINLRWFNAGKNLAAITKETIESIANTIKNDNTLEHEWQKKLAFGGSGSATTFGKLYSRQIKDAKDYYSFWFEDMKKVYDEQTKQIRNMFIPLKEKWDIEIDPSIKFNTNEIAKLIKIRNSIKAKIGGGVSSTETKEQLEPILKSLESQITLAQAMKDAGIEFEDKSNRNRTGSFKDKEAEVWEQRIKLIQEARREYEYWEKKIGGAAAQEKVKEKFSTLVGVDEILKPGDLDDLEHYEKALRSIRDEVEKRYELDKKLAKGQTKDTKIANDIKELRELANAINAIEKAQFERASEQFVSKMSAAVEELTDNWERYNIVRKATGDIGLAARMAGVNPAAKPQDTVANDVKNMLQEQLRNIGGEGLVNSIPLDVHLDEESLREKLKASVPEAYKNEIEGLVKAYQEWQKLQKQVIKDDVQMFSSLMGSAVDLQSELLKIQEKYDSTIKSIARLRKEDTEGKHSAEYDRAEVIAAANRDIATIQASADYKMLMDGVVTMTEKAAETIKSQYIDALNKGLSSGAISAKTYADRIKEINEKLSALRNYRGDFFAFFTGGLEGLYQSRIERGRSKIEEGALTGNDELINVGKELVEIGLRGLDSMNLISNTVHGIDGIVQGSNSIFQNIRKAYSDIGVNTSSGGWGVADIVFSSLSAVSSGTTKALDALARGDSMGAAAALNEEALGLVSQIRKDHDEGLEDDIKELKALVGVIEANTASINRMRNRMFGYDTGAAGLLGYYRSKYTGDDKISEEMRDFYKSSDVSGYAQELKNLQDEREKYMEMYNKEEAKKDESQEALAEFKTKIAELDDQIRYFTEDLANELWGIDIKGWADQFTDALATAFENGEDMFEAFNDTAKSIMQSVVQEMMKIGIIEPMIERLRNKLFGYTDSNGVFQNGIISADELTSNPNAASKKLLNEIQKFFKPGGEGSGMVEAVQGYLEGVNVLMEELSYSNGLKNNESGKTLTASVQGMTEETADMLAGYVNALRQDVAENRLLLTQFVAQFWPDYEEAFMAQVGAVNRIDNNVQAMMEMMRYGSGALYDELRALRARVDNVVDGAESFAMR